MGPSIGRGKSLVKLRTETWFLINWLLFELKQIVYVAFERINNGGEKEAD